MIQHVPSFSCCTETSACVFNWQFPYLPSLTLYFKLVLIIKCSPQGFQIFAVYATFSNEETIFNTHITITKMTVSYILILSSVASRQDKCSSFYKRLAVFSSVPYVTVPLPVLPSSGESCNKQADYHVQMTQWHNVHMIQLWDLPIVNIASQPRTWRPFIRFSKFIQQALFDQYLLCRCLEAKASWYMILPLFLWWCQATTPKHMEIADMQEILWAKNNQSEDE
jgi:hypothetical protein